MFTRKELAYFNVCRRVYPWIGNCAVSSGLILITDNMFNKEWRFFKYSLEGVDYYVIKTRPDDNGQFILCTVESFDMAMIALEKILWNKASSEQPFSFSLISSHIRNRISYFLPVRMADPDSPIHVDSHLPFILRGFWDRRMIFPRIHTSSPEKHRMPP